MPWRPRPPPPTSRCPPCAQYSGRLDVGPAPPRPWSTGARSSGRRCLLVDVDVVEEGEHGGEYAEAGVDVGGGEVAVDGAEQGVFAGVYGFDGGRAGGGEPDQAGSAVGGGGGRFDEVLGCVRVYHDQYDLAAVCVC